MSAPTFILGNPEHATETTAVRGGAIEFRSRHGLRAISRLLIESLPKQCAGPVLAGQSAEPAVALAMSALYPGARVVHFELDSYVAARARAVLAHNGVATIEVIAAADVPGVTFTDDRADATFKGSPFAAIALPFPARGDAKLARDLVEQAALALLPGGSFYAGTDHADGEWVKELVRDVFGKADAVRREADEGVVFLAKKGDKRVRAKDRRHDIIVEHAGAKLAFTSRPGTFTYGRLDGGTKALLASSALAAVPPCAAEVIADFGAGIGILGLVVTSVRHSARAILLESNARSADLAAANARRLGLAADIVRAPDASDLAGASADLALTNPPYFANFRIAEQFINDAHRVLRPGGTLLLVAKERTHHAELIRQRFGDLRVEEVGGYGVFVAER